MIAEDPTNADYRRSLVVNYQHVGNHRKQSDKRGALEAFLQTRAGEAFRDVLNFLLKTGEFETAVKDADTFLKVEMPAAYRWDFTPQQAAQIKVPVLSLLGANSPMRAQKVQDFLVSWIPHTEKMVLAGAEHALPLMDPPGIAAALANWFAKYPMQMAQYSMPASA